MRGLGGSTVNIRASANCGLCVIRDQPRPVTARASQQARPAGGWLMGHQLETSLPQRPHLHPETLTEGPHLSGRVLSTPGPPQCPCAAGQLRAPRAGAKGAGPWGASESGNTLEGYRSYGQNCITKVRVHPGRRTICAVQAAGGSRVELARASCKKFC